MEPVEVVAATDEVEVASETARRKEGPNPGLAKIFESPLDRFESWPGRAFGPPDQVSRLFRTVPCRPV